MRPALLFKCDNRLIKLALVMCIQISINVLYTMYCMFYLAAYSALGVSKRDESRWRMLTRLRLARTHVSLIKCDGYCWGYNAVYSDIIHLDTRYFIITLQNESRSASLTRIALRQYAGRS